MLEEAKMGGLVQVFTRYHEAGVTRIRGRRICGGVIGFDANMLYPSCSAGKMPCVKEKVIKCRNAYDLQHISETLEKVKDGSLFGFFEVDAHVPDELNEQFSEFPPLIVRVEVPEENVPLQMRNYSEATGRKKSSKGTKNMVCVMKDEKMWANGEHLVWLLEKKIKVTAVQTMILYKEGKPFAFFPRRFQKLGVKQIKILRRSLQEITKNFSETPE